MIIEEFDINPNKIPPHIAIIMDGNGRWATKNGYNRIKGHYMGMEVLMNVVEMCKELKIKILSVFAFSTENWKRPQSEVNSLMNLMVEFYKKKFSSIKKEKIKIMHTGTLDKTPDKIKKIMDKMVEETKSFNNSILNVVFNYGGRYEIVDAAKKMYTDIKQNNIKLSDITEEYFSKYLYLPTLPYPDLMIRTGGEIRISNFMLWELAYTELWFTDTLWPNFTKKELIQAIYDYQKRERRFGKVK